MGYQKFNNTREKNGYLHTVSNILKNVTGSASEAEVGALLYYGYEAEPICNTLHNMGHTQPNTPCKLKIPPQTAL